MRIRVDPQKCQGHNRCKAMADALYSLDEYGYATAVNEGVVPAGMEDKARLSVDNCPEFAIEIIEE